MKERTIKRKIKQQFQFASPTHHKYKESISITKAKVDTNNRQKTTNHRPEPIQR
jgi:hypothetical protein